MENAVVDVPTIHQAWAYLCQGCRPKYQAVFAERAGSVLALWVSQKVDEPPPIDFILAKELTPFEDAVLGRLERTIQCPICGQRRTIDMHTSGPTDCICGQILKVLDLMEVA